MIEIPALLYDDLRAHGEATYPAECCGILLGHAGSRNRVTEVLRVENQRIDSPHNRFQIAPADLIRVQKHARAAGVEIVGFYHSHPDHPAEWSQTDLEEAHWLGSSYLISSVEKGRVALTNSFRLLGVSEEDKHFLPEPVTVTRGV